MRRFLLFAATLTACISLQAQRPYEIAPAIVHLSEVNAEWTHQPNLAPLEEVHFENDIQRIHYHLDWVVQNLRKQPLSDLSPDQQQNRLRLIDTLEAYAANEVFPQNIYHLQRRPYFIDHRGVHCAVGYLMKASGHGDLAQRISLEQNYAYVREIRTEGVAEWADDHGFSLDELAWIQPGYAPSTPISTIGTGTNGPVLTMAPDFYDGGFVFAGDFTVLDGSPCDGVGYYRDGDLTCLPGLRGCLGFGVSRSNAGFLRSGKEIFREIASYFEEN